VNNRRVSGLALLAVLLGGAGCSIASLHAGAPIGDTAIVHRTPKPTSSAGPYLYVAGSRISMYALGSTTPLHSTTINYYVLQAAIALDGQGNLCEANGNVSYPQIYAYNARTLQFESAFNGDGLGQIAANRSGYLYDAGGIYTLVYAPGCTHWVGTLHGCQCGSLVFDGSGNFYGGSGGVRVYAPTQRTWHMTFTRTIHFGVDGPRALAIGPSGQLYVANFGDSSVSVFQSGGSDPIRRITKGLASPTALALDAKGVLYAANNPGSAYGWVSVYAPGSGRLIREIGKYPRFFPNALAVDPSDNLYVAAGNRVDVYSPGATKLLRTITKGVYAPTALLIGSP
jgi:DNA-binding beta-propeller fold protein YncE